MTITLEIDGTESSINIVPIKHCPYCGLELGPPDVKIEVSRETLDGWIDELRGAFFAGSRARKLDDACRSKVFRHIDNLWRSIRTVGGYD